MVGEKFRVGQDNSDVHRNNTALVNQQLSAEAQKVVLLMEIARSLDLIVEHLKGNL
ncbi:Uncharacterised protein [Mycobacteroides abscessus subsp. massiliense]|nr:Uncharacterised protein [Mycobacteroides abscessus subsp. abscessus]SKM67205.1 Uncharacterised protein [Mycobacteroides abscessus subsp. massiliense]SKN33628.1 Uncharacterised protein [Mycobacteroides abscessus subsp. massiliense]SKP15514.1 Uncharacterised protein [Mycobacteroides abscessus subsp. massiliense]SKP58481.1 Uncharacterised protein [Mycobacteroides abscessus subsp. massiliense]